MCEGVTQVMVVTCIMCDGVILVMAVTLCVCDPGDGCDVVSRLVVFGDVESAERALHEYNDSILNSRNMKLRKVGGCDPCEGVAIWLPRPGTDNRGQRQRVSARLWLQEGPASSGPRLHCLCA